MKVVFLNPIGDIGGGERSLLLLLEKVGLHLPGLECMLVLGSDGPLVGLAQSLGIAVHVLPLPDALLGAGDSWLRDYAKPTAFLDRLWELPQALLGLGSHVRQLRRLLRQVRPDLIHSNGMKTHLSSALARPAAPLVWHLRDYVTHRPLMNWLLRALAHRTCLAVANSQSVAADARRAFPRARVECVLNGVDTVKFTPGSGGSSLDRLAGMPEGPPGMVRVGLLATYARWKGQDVFLRSLALLSRENLPSHRFYIIGSPIYRTAGSQFTEKELRTLAQSLGVAERVGFIPFQDDTLGIYRSLDVVVHASTRPEPFGLVIAEAMACGKPVVVSAAGGACELFTEGKDGLGHRPGDAVGLAAAVGRLVRDPELRACLGTTARTTALQQFSADRCATAVVALYRSICHIAAAECKNPDSDGVSPAPYTNEDADERSPDARITD